MDNRFPSNSYTAKDQKRKKPASEKKVEKVTKSHVRAKKKGVGERFRETFLAMDFLDAIKRVLIEVLIPDTQGTVSELIKGTVDMMIYGDRKGRGRGGNRSPIGYNGMSYQSYYNQNGAPRNDPRPDVSRPYSKPIVEDYVFDTRDDAEEVLDRLRELIRDYSAASVRDLCQLAGVSSDYTKDKYGWFNLDGAGCIRVSDGWLLDLPRPQVID